MKTLLAILGLLFAFNTAVKSQEKCSLLADAIKLYEEDNYKDAIKSFKAIKKDSQKGDDCPPVIVESQGLKGGTVRIKGEESSQFLSSLLMVAPYALKDVSIEVTGPLASKPYVDITQDVMSAFGVEIKARGSVPFSLRQDNAIFHKNIGLKGMLQAPPIFFRQQRFAGGE